MKKERWLDKAEIINVIKSFNKNPDKLEINVVFANSNFKRKEKYKVYNLLTSNKVILPTVISSIKYLEEEFERRSFEIYDLELSVDDTVQIVESDKVLNGMEAIEKMHETVKDDKQILSDKVGLKTLDFIIIQLYNAESREKMYILKKYVHPTTKYKRSFKFTLNGKEVAPFTKELLTINHIVDAILYKDNYYILNRKNFNTIFNFKDLFYKIIEDNKQVIEQSNLFYESSQFIQDCSDDGRHLPRLTKVILAKGFENVTNHKEKLPNLKSQYKLSFELTEDNKIKYGNKKEIKDILDVLLDHFVISALTNNKMIAKAIEKYKV